MQKNTFPRIAPFALFMAFIGLEELLRFLAGKGLVSLSSSAVYYLYPVKALSVALLLVYYRNSYQEIRLRDIARFRETLISISVGLLVFVLWINMDFASAVIGTPQGFNPNLLSGNFTIAAMTAARLFGAVLVVPVMEELFWRSFLIRYIINPDFSKVPIGLFTWSSFLLTVLLFGLEHNLFLAGMMAGTAYNLLLYRTKSLAHCILAHAVTNLALGIYVIYTGNWQFW